MSSTQDHPQKGRIWLFTGIASAFLMALFWSVDSSLVYLLMGVSAFSFFQYFYTHRAESIHERWKSSSAATEQKTTQTSGNNLDEVLENIQRSFKTTSGQPNVGAVIKTIFGFMFFLFFISVIGFIFFSDDSVLDDSYMKGNQFFDMAEYDSALHYYQLALQENPDDPFIYYGRGNAFINMGRYDSAIAQYDKALILDNQFNDARYNKGYALYLQNRYKDSIRETRKVTDNDPENTNAILLIGDGYYSQTQYDSAMYWYNQAYDLDYRSAALSHVMAFIYDTQGQPQKAIPFYQEAIGMDSSLVDIYRRLGELIPGEEGNWYRTKAAQVNQQ